ncbi:MAG TPA: serine hydroxymethyltransferase [Candidatus Nanoarchaeia archaeon]|nr:serine hydroxymethyltransferase [uncultured archaeon]
MLEKVDPKVAQIIKKEEVRQERVINLIASENYTSKAVREALGSVFTNKYSEGYPLKRYYGGNEFVDEVETLAQERAKKLFGVNFANVQGYSGSPANLAIYFALAEVGDTIMGLSLPSGGHLTHGWGVNFSGKYYKSVQYTVNAETELIDFDNMLSLAKEHKPKLIWAGATAYSRVFDWKRFREVCDEVGAYLIADVSHIAGLIVAGVHPSPVGIADVIMTTTHKTLRGPRGALILTNDEELATKIDKAVFPGLQGGPHNNTTAAIAVCLQEASTAEFKAYGKQVVENAKTLASVLLNQGFRLVSGGTDNHMLLIDFGEGGLTGKEAESILETVGIIVNRNTVPGETRKPFVTSGIRLGTPAVTTRGFSKQEMQTVAEMIASVLKNPSDSEIARKTLSLVKGLTEKFPLPP